MTSLLHPESHPLHHLLLVTTRAPGAIRDFWLLVSTRKSWVSWVSCQVGSQSQFCSCKIMQQHMHVTSNNLPVSPNSSTLKRKKQHITTGQNLDTPDSSKHLFPQIQSAQCADGGRVGNDICLDSWQGCAMGSTVIPCGPPAIISELEKLSLSRINYSEMAMAIYQL